MDARHATPESAGGAPPGDVRSGEHAAMVGAAFRESRIVVEIAVRNSRATVRRALESALRQDGCGIRVGVLVLDDASTDRWESGVLDLLEDPRVAVVRTCLGSAWSARNALMELAERLCPDLEWHARLDADDVLIGSAAVRRLLRAAVSPSVVACLGGNFQRLAGRILREPNRAVLRLLDPPYVLARLERMAALEAAAELPSCNLLLRARTGVRYPAETSAEDHWLVARLLLTERGRVRVCPDVIYCEYTLGGTMTAGNQRSTAYADSRRRLLEQAREWAR